MSENVRASSRPTQTAPPITQRASTSGQGQDVGPTVFVRSLTADTERRDLNAAVHKILVVGLAVSTVLLVIGVVLGIIEHQPMPNATLSVGEALQRLVGLRPSAFLNLGLLALIVTPVLRVVGSVFVFLFERDWRYAGITALVLVIMLISLLSGHGG